MDVVPPQQTIIQYIYISGCTLATRKNHFLLYFCYFSLFLFNLTSKFDFKYVNVENLNTLKMKFIC
jgi:hypothetical protein